MMHDVVSSYRLLFRESDKSKVAMFFVGMPHGFLNDLYYRYRYLGDGLYVGFLDVVNKLSIYLSISADKENIYSLVIHSSVCLRNRCPELHAIFI